MKKRGGKILAAVLSVGLLATSWMLPSVAADEAAPITVFVDGNQIQFDVQPITENYRTLVPMRFIFEALGATVSWDDSTNTATAVKGDTTVTVTVDSNKMLKNGTEIVLDVPARMVNDRTLVPVRAVSESFDAVVEWKEESQQVIITTAAEPAATSEPSSSPAPEEPASSVAEMYSAGELSADDLQMLKDSYGEIRYTFEQQVLVESVLLENEDLIAAIAEQRDEVKDFVRGVWNTTVASQILNIQIDSESDYLIESSENITLETYLPLMEEAGLRAEDIFDMSYETLEDGSVMLLLTFKNTDTLLACKYIGITVLPDKTLRYFTAETDPMTTDALFICEVLPDKRGTILTADMDVDFVDAVNTILENDLQFLTSLESAE